MLPKGMGWRAWTIAGAGFVLALLPTEIYSVLHFGTLVPPHVATNATELGQDWSSSRAAIASSWFLSRVDGSFWKFAPALICAAASVFVGARRDGRAFLWTLALANVALVVLTAPNNGGGQWGVRYMLCLSVPLAVLASDLAEALAVRKIAGIAALATICAGSVWVQRDAYRQLRSTKITYGRIVDFVANETPPSGTAVTDVWWLDQIAAAVTANRQILYAPDTAVAQGILKRLDDVSATRVTIIRSPSESPDAGTWTSSSSVIGSPSATSSPFG
jgi:hypothetical protein